MSDQLVAETSTWQHMTLTTDKYPCPRWDSNPRSQQASGRVARLLWSWVWIPPGAWIFVCCECRVLWGRGLCDELITRPEESYRLCCVVVCDLQTSRMGAPYIYDISRLRVNIPRYTCIGRPLTGRPLWKLWGFHRCVIDDFSVFGCHTASLGKWFLTCRKFGITYPAM
jgi:hypothetical protein